YRRTPRWFWFHHVPADDSSTLAAVQSHEYVALRAVDHRGDGRIRDEYGSVGRSVRACRYGYCSRPERYLDAPHPYSSCRSSVGPRHRGATGLVRKASHRKASSIW